MKRFQNNGPKKISATRRIADRETSVSQDHGGWDKLSAPLKPLKTWNLLHTALWFREGWGGLLTGPHYADTRYFFGQPMSVFFSGYQSKPPAIFGQQILTEILKINTFLSLYIMNYKHSQTFISSIKFWIKIPMNNRYIYIHRSCPI